MVGIENERLQRREQPEVALTPRASGNRTYSVCTVCGALMRTPAENAATACVPKARPIREDDPKLGVRVKPFGK